MTEPNEAGPELQGTSDEPQNIVVAIDASLSASRVVSAAVRMTRAMPLAVLHILHVYRTSRFDHAHSGVPQTPSDAIADAKEHLESHVRAARKQGRAQVVGHFAVGDPTAEVKRLCAEIDADLLVVGTHDLHGLERLLLGSVAETLVRSVACSVLVVRSKPQI